MSQPKAWPTPLCGQNPGFVHATECVSMVACPWCGQANPNKGVKEKLSQTTTTFNDSVTKSRELRQKAIVTGKKFLPGRNNIGSSLPSAEKENLTKLPPSYSLLVTLWKPQDDEAPWFNGRWLNVDNFTILLSESDVFTINTIDELVHELEPGCRELRQLVRSKFRYTPRLASTASDKKAEFLSDTVLRAGFNNMLLNLEIDTKKKREASGPLYKLHICFGKYPELQSDGERTVNISDGIPDDDMNYYTDTTDHIFAPLDSDPQPGASKRRRASSASSFPVSKTKKIQTQHETSAEPIIKKEKEPLGTTHTRVDHEIISISSSDDEATLSEAFRLVEKVLRETKKRLSLAEGQDKELKVKHELVGEANLSDIPADEANLPEEPAEEAISSEEEPAEEANLSTLSNLAQDGPATNTRRRHGKSFPKKHLL